MWNWKQELVEYQRHSNKFYGRYIDDILLTSNESIEKLHELLDIANERHSNIKLTYVINSIISFLDVRIEKIHDHLITSVYHKSASEPYVVPFKSDHPRHVFANIIQGALLRAVRYSSTLKEFNHERRSIQLMPLYNGYPIRYINRHFRKFFITNSIISTSVLSNIHDENEYLFLRRQILTVSTRSEHARANQIASQMDYNQINSAIDTLVKAKLLKQQQKGKSIIIHFTYERRFAHYKSKIHQIWNASFQKTTGIEPKLIVGTRNNPNLTNELVRRSPQQGQHPNTATP